MKASTMLMDVWILFSFQVSLFLKWFLFYNETYFYIKFSCFQFDLCFDIGYTNYFLLILLIIQIVVHKNSPRKNALSACKTSPKGITQFSSYVNVKGVIFNYPLNLIAKVITLNNMLSVTSDSILGYDLQIPGNILQVLQPFSIFSYIIGVISI